MKNLSGGENANNWMPENAKKSKAKVLKNDVEIVERDVKSEIMKISTSLNKIKMDLESIYDYKRTKGVYDHIVVLELIIMEMNNENR